MTNELGDTALERTFEFRDPNGNSGTILLRIGIPYLFNESTTSLKWRCPYQLVGIGSEKIRLGHGMDAIDALLLSLRIAELYLENHARRNDVKITWLGEEELMLSPIEIPNQDMNSSEVDNPLFEEIFEEFFRNFERKSKDSLL